MIKKEGVRQNVMGECEEIRGGTDSIGHCKPLPIQGLLN